MKRAFELVCLAVTAVGAIAAFAGSYIILPYRVSAVEHRQELLQKQITNAAASTSADHELLVRIDERVREVRDTLNVREVRSNENK